MSPRRSMPVLVLAVLALSAMACSLISLPFGGSDDQAPTEPAVMEAVESDTEPTASPEPAQPSDGGGSLPVAQGECANNLLPMQVGNQWTYVQMGGTEGETSGSSFTWTVVEVGPSSATVEFRSEDLPVAASYTVECADGAILTFPTISFSLALPGGGGGAADIRYQHTGGVFLPSLQTLEENNWNYMWETEGVISGEISTSPAEGQTFDVTLEEAPWSMLWSTVGDGPSAFETVEVPAGVFDQAVPLRQESDMTFSMSFEGNNFQSQFSSTSTQWYAPGVGLIKSRTEAGTMSMSGFDMPATEDGGGSTLELAEFRQGVDVSSE